MSLTMIVTNAGRAALVNATNTGTAPVIIAQAGLSGTSWTPTVGATVLPDEFLRLDTLSGDVVADDTIHIIVRDEGAAVYAVRSLGLYLGDGTLFAVYGQGTPILEKSSQSMMLLAIDVRFADILATNISFGDANFLNPPATTERQGVVELATSAEMSLGTDVQRAGTPKAIRDAVFAWLDARLGASNSGIWHPGNDGAGSGLDADLLDGQQGSYYSNIIARLGYAPVNKAGDTMSNTLTLPSVIIAGGPGNNGLSGGNGDGATYSTYNLTMNLWFGLGIKTYDGSVNGVYDARAGRWDVKSGYRVNGLDVWHSGNDGAGSGLDADLLDGQQGSYYSDVPARLGFTPVQQGTGISQGTNTVRIGWSSAGRLRCTVDASDQGNFVFDSQLNAAIGGVWRYDNDGAGSGLDADLLDGNHANSFALRSGDVFSGDIVTYRASSPTTGVIFLGQASNRYLYYDGTNYHLSGAELFINNGARAWHANNDGAGSGLDADMLDGQHGNYYSDIAGRLGFTPVRQGGGAGQNANVIYIGWSGTRLKGQVDGVDLGNFVFDGQLSAAIGGVWRPDNDGSGSGLDADLLDGRHASDFALASGFTSGSNGNGFWSRRPDGVIEQWGRFATSGLENYYTVTFPIAFTNAASISISATAVLRNSNDDVFPAISGSPTTDGFTVLQNAIGDQELTNGFHWRAIGV